MRQLSQPSLVSATPLNDRLNAIALADAIQMRRLDAQTERAMAYQAGECYDCGLQIENCCCDELAADLWQRGVL